MSKILFNPQLSSISPASQIKNNKNPKNNLITDKSQIKELPSFKGLIPIYEDAKCRTMLRCAKTEDGKLRFNTNEEIRMMLNAIKTFKSKNKKTDLLEMLLYDKTLGKKYPTEMSAENITEYFTYLSGAPKDIQKYIAREFGECSTSEIAKNAINLFKTGVITNKELEYSDKRIKDLTLFDETQEMDFVTVFRLIEQFPFMGKHLDIIFDKIETDLETDSDGFLDMLPEALPKANEKSVLNILSLLNENTSYPLGMIIAHLRNPEINEQHLNTFLTSLNNENIEYVRFAIETKTPEKITEDLKYFKEKNMPLPKPKSYKQSDINEYKKRIANIGTNAN